MGCQKKPSEPAFGKIIGSNDNQTLRYSDRQLTLTYKGGEVCSSGFKRTTVINFHCNQQAEDEGRGKPVFGTEDSCSYVFDWDTKYACIESIFHGTCQVQHGRQSFDLSALKVDDEEDDYWQALVPDSSSSKGSYYLTACGAINRTLDGKTCPTGAAICFIGEDGTVKSLGKYQSSPTYNATMKTINLKYTEGDTCVGNKKIETHITFRCKPGDPQSAPVVSFISSDKCYYELEWETPAACVISTKRGSNCSVFDDTLGIYFDLNTLKSGGEGYSVIAGEHTYYLDVCTKVNNAPCKDKNAGVCQVKTQDTSQVFNAGQPNSELNYKNGFVNLTYTSGDTYHTTPPVSRSSEIMFICDHKAGKGKPEFQGENEHTYSFIWRTANICPRALVECVAMDPKTYKQIDLARLVKTNDNWEVETDESGTKRKFYLNVCHTLSGSAKSLGCSPHASICSTKIENGKETLEHDNLGEPISRPVVSDNEVILTYSTGTSSCTDEDGTKKPYVTKIHFMCETNQPTTKPDFMGHQGKCEFSFMWRTREACGLDSVKKNTTKTDCTIKDPQSSHVFNLEPLKRNKTAPYTVFSDVGRFTMNICDSVGPSKCGTSNGAEPAVCRETTIVGQQGGQIAFNEAGGLSLTYAASESGDDYKVVVNFICNQTIPSGEPTFRESYGNTYIFEFHTSVACRPQPVECLVFDKQGNRYDLSPLTRAGGAWEVSDSRSSQSHLTYYINVCAPIAGVFGCIGRSPGGCQVSGTGSSWSMGYVQSKPVAVGDGTITLRYLGGTICHKGKAAESHRSTRINFFCSNKEEDPVFEGETETCEYVFSWRTPSACSLKRTLGSDCIVRDPLYNTQFSLRSLQSNTNNYQVEDNGVKFDLNVCRALTSPAEECKEAGGCQTLADGRHFNMGVANGNLTYEDGELSLTYHDGANCHGKYKRETHLRFVCDHNAFGTGKEAIKFINETGECAYQFVWTTSFACMPFHVVQCGTSSGGSHYELSHLTLTGDNYEISLPTRRQKVVLNVCTTLVHKKGITCPPYSAACVINLDETDPKKRFQTIGGLTGDPVKIDAQGKLTISYSSEEVCSSDSSSKYSTIINLTCNKDARGPPTFLFEESCVYHFAWETPYACADNEQPKPPAGDCTVTNPLTGAKFDLSRWRTEQGYMVEGWNGAKYRLNVCKALADTPCGPKSGVCQETADGKHYNAGNATSQVTFRQGAVFLNYTDGQMCHHSNTPRNSLLQFVCGAPGSGNGDLQFIAESSDCTYYFTWSTEYACEYEAKWSCSVENDKGQVIDLSSLMSKTGSIPAVSRVASDSSYHINICRPLVNSQGGNCPALAAACSVGKESKSLGRVTAKPVWDASTNQVVITYANGDTCDTSPDRKFTTKVLLQCQEGDEVGTPILISKTDCHHVFLWETNVACPRGGSVSPTNCKVKSPQTNQEYDLAMFAGKEAYEVDTSAGKYFLNICHGPVSTAPGCTGAAVCYVPKGESGSSFGLLSNMTAVWNGNGLKVTYSDGAKCGATDDEKGKTIINFKCDKTVAGKGAPVLSMKTNCDVVFDWKTSLICPVVRKECLVQHGNKVFDLGDLSRETGSWTFNGTDGSSYWMNMCSGIHQGGADCPPSAAVCQKSKDGTTKVLGTIAEQNLSYDEKNKRLVVEYGSGTACPTHNSKVKIYMPCGQTLGTPQALPRVGENCLFEFMWKTRLACETSRTEVPVEGGHVSNPRTGGVMDLNALYSQVIKTAKIEGSQNIEYYFALTGSLKRKGCENAAVCKEAADGSTVVIGAASSRIFYMEDDILEMVSTSTENCEPHGQKRSTTSFQLHCSRANITTQPKLVYKSSKCDYFFMWYTAQACVLNAVSDLVYHPAAHSQHASAAGAVVITLLVLIVIIVLGIIFGKRERRQAISNRVRSVFSGSYVGRSMSYSRDWSRLDDEPENC